VGLIAHQVTHTPGKEREMPAPYFGLFAPMKAPDALRPDNKRGPSWWTRLRVRWKRLDLDSALAYGANPVTSEEFALRAQQLADSTNRERLATGLENLFHLATTGPGPGATTAMAVSSNPESRSYGGKRRGILRSRRRIRVARRDRPDLELGSRRLLSA
jgi:hypothetical protein